MLDFCTCSIRQRLAKLLLLLLCLGRARCAAMQALRHDMMLAHTGALVARSPCASATAPRLGESALTGAGCCTGVPVCTTHNCLAGYQA